MKLLVYDPSLYWTLGNPAFTLSILSAVVCVFLPVALGHASCWELRSEVV